VCKHYVDDASLFQAIKLLVDWRVPKAGRDAIVTLASGLAATGSAIAFVGALWLLAKYGHACEITRVLRENPDTWKSNPFVARQVAAICLRLEDETDEVHWISETLRMSGHTDALRISANVNDLRSASCLERADRMYLVPTSFSGPYPLPKVLLAKAILNSDVPRAQRKELKDQLLRIVGDPWYKRQLRSIRV
jgi:hypothetical protein